MKRCMIIDDSSIIRKVVNRILGSQDTVVVEASNGTDALAMCAAQMPDTIIVDCVLPDMASSDFIRDVKALPSGKNVRILISILEFDIGTIMRAKRAGANGYMFKPFNRAQLVERFRELQEAA
ncbi:response regulator [Nitratireductor sp. CAU 1489]|uniref:Response regulator n=1 Tax=Nitratireductor arenosus TaxID=2682096 RepID=A0A844QKL4_9HYPH|nr:response regulator [Nitratireductor arenosus]MVA98588.1 response regulator [Nitratireductor arenosus]